MFLKRLRWKHGTLKAKSHITVWSPEKKKNFRGKTNQLESICVRKILYSFTHQIFTESLTNATQRLQAISLPSQSCHSTGGRSSESEGEKWTSKWNSQIWVQTQSQIFKSYKFLDTLLNLSELVSLFTSRNDTTYHTCLLLGSNKIGVVLPVF